jgi:aminoglycoside phosphotransferase family enzyme
MPENCPHHTSHDQRLSSLETRMETAEVIINDLGKNHARAEVKTETIVAVLEELKAMIRELQIETREALKQAVQQKDFQRIEGQVNTQWTRIDELKAKPGKRWEQLVGYLLAAVVSLVIGAVLAGWRPPA